MADSVRMLRSSLLLRHGFRHGFPERVGGVSEPPFSSLNLGRALGDRPERVSENHLRLARAVPCSPSALYEVTQVHGRAVRVVDPSEAPADLRSVRADALVARATGVALGVRVADCASVLLGDRRTGAVAAVHAGWRGAVDGVLLEAIGAMERAFGTAPEDLLAAIGPHIRPARFEIGPEVAARMEAVAEGARVVVRGPGRPHGDLAALLRHQLRAAGVPDSQVDDLGGCTYDEPARFFSHRRDRGATGRHLAVIVGR